jgi:hypothetical protein
MEFLVINLTNDSSLLLHAIHSPFYRLILQKNYTFFGFKNPYKKICETRKLESILEKPFLERENEGRKPDNNLSLRLLEFMLETSTKNAVQKFHLREGLCGSCLSV